MLYDAQAQLYHRGGYRSVATYTDETLGQDQYRIDYPPTLNPDRIEKISVLFSGVWSPPLTRGIDPEHYTHQDNKGPPVRYELFELGGYNIEFWPTADAEYTVRVFGYTELGAFSTDNDRTTLDSDMVFIVALGMAKAHYRQPDAQLYLDQGEAVFASLKARAWEGRIFNPSRRPEATTYPKPVVV
jgi:hypothetical protein